MNVLISRKLSDGFVWERQEHDKGIIWNRLSDRVSEQGVMYHYYSDTKAWYFHPNSSTKPTKLLVPPCIEMEYQSSL